MCECRVRAGARSGLRCSRPLFPTRLYLLRPWSRTSPHPCGSPRGPGFATCRMHKCAVQGCTNAAGGPSRHPCLPGHSHIPVRRRMRTTPWMEEVERSRMPEPRSGLRRPKRKPYSLRSFVLSLECAESGYIPVHHPRPNALPATAPALLYLPTSLWVAARPGFAHPCASKKRPEGRFSIALCLLFIWRWIPCNRRLP
jgi:hypothetical protein